MLLAEKVNYASSHTFNCKMLCVCIYVCVSVCVLEGD